jgi:hypothetical protein
MLGGVWKSPCKGLVGVPIAVWTAKDGVVVPAHDNDAKVKAPCDAGLTDLSVIGTMVRC